jgi:hypothetical protein
MPEARNTGGSLNQSVERNKTTVMVRGDLTEIQTAYRIYSIS